MRHDYSAVETINSQWQRIRQGWSITESLEKGSSRLLVGSTRPLCA